MTFPLGDCTLPPWLLSFFPSVNFRFRPFRSGPSRRESTTSIERSTFDLPSIFLFELCLN
ncbi:hypothetical protein M6B38_328275 [Iris pallida]|uniref:Uncharacterized protein n=1 Tax=Iris pallida TaxID=29817 RepID=A0AAX6H7X7_IRIPA|nr:hypothetical protein M6B38_384150 [Iris pallida]KAJ6836485.1 hypothetical protein M6B38_328275 [Iris pallida]